LWIVPSSWRPVFVSQCGHRAGAQGISDMASKKQKPKVSKVMGEFKEGKLESGSKKGPKVKSRKQAVAIAMSESGQAKPK
jgi:hypothetical protein